MAVELNKVYFEDCVLEDPNKGMNRITDKSIDMILCDLPYGTTQNKWDTIIPFDILWRHYSRVIKDNGAIVLFGAEPFSSMLRLSNLNHYKYDWIWDKVKGTGYLNAKKQPMRNHETISVFYKKQCIYNPQKTTGHERKVSTALHKRGSVMTENYGTHKATGYDSTERYPRSIQVFGSDIQKEALHPTQKPVALSEYLIKTYTNKGAVILDNCAGSGTTAIACINTERSFICFESMEKYYHISNQRIYSHLDFRK